MKRQIMHMINYKYFPIKIGKKVRTLVVTMTIMLDKEPESTSIVVESTCTFASSGGANSCFLSLTNFPNFNWSNINMHIRFIKWGQLMCLGAWTNFKWSRIIMHIRFIRWGQLMCLIWFAPQEAVQANYG